MNQKIIIPLLFLILSFHTLAQEPVKWSIAIHGGAGNFSKEDISDSLQQAYTMAMEKALNEGASLLRNRGSALDAVEAVIIILENCPLFNAGKGAVFTAEGKNELDASIMDGRDLNAGAVAGVTKIKNPISAARKVMTNSKHVLLAREGADAFAREQGLELVDPSYFFTQKRWDALQQAQLKNKKMGTVGCVALDIYGNLAAGTSTGGMTNKEFGRIGDSPIIGAGTYANNNTCAVSCTGHGEYFIRYAVAHDISARMEYLGENLDRAAHHVINGKLKKAHANGGVIAMDKSGNIIAAFNTTGMFRGWLKSTGEKKISLYKED